MLPTDPAPPTATPAGTGLPPPPPPPPFRLVRARGGYLGGVCRGLATSAGIDVTLMRLAFVAAAFAGVGVVAYIVLWIVVPVEDPAAQRPLLPAPPETAKLIRIAAIIGAVVGVASLVGVRTGFGVSLGGPGLLGVALIAGGIYYLVARRRVDGPGANVPTQPVPSPLAEAQDGIDPATATVVRRGPGLGLIFARIVGWMAIIGGLLLAIPFAILVGVGAMSLRLPALAGLVAVASLGLLVATTAGARRAWPILVSLVVFLGAGALALGLTEWDGGVDERTSQPISAAEVAPSYRLTAGRRVLDLTFVEVPEAGLDVRIDQGVGQVEVIVPAAASVVADVHVNLGEARVLGRVERGSDVQLTARTGPPEAPTLRLAIDLGAGQVRVCQASNLTLGQLSCGPVS